MIDRETRRKVGQLFLFGFQGRNVTPFVKDLVSKHNVAGLVFFSRNISEPGQLWELNRTIHAPGLIRAIDHEGGRVIRVGEPVTQFPPARKIGETAAPDLAYKAGHYQAQELAALGLNLNFAPVLDVATNPFNQVIGDRAFSSDPALVAKLGAETVRGIQDAGVAACGKHFPGHGDTRDDSHATLPRSGTEPSTIRGREMVPFSAAIRAGVKSVMTAHVLYETMDSRLPATLSSAIIQGLLRDTLKFDGVVITDDLEMRGVADGFGIEERTLLSIKAGADLLLFCHTPDTQMAAIETVCKAVEGRILSKERIETSWRRVQELKRFCAGAQAAPDRGRLFAVLGDVEHKALAGSFA